MTTEDHDINDLFDDIVLTEERLSRENYKEGFLQGEIRGKLEGYKLGYAQGVQLGEELGDIYGTAFAHLLQIRKEIVRKKLLQLMKAIIAFPQSNDPDKDIIVELECIRTLYRRVKAMLHLPQKEMNSTDSLMDPPNLSF